MPSPSTSKRVVLHDSLATLTSRGQHAPPAGRRLSDDEVLFIDRDGPSFRYVLNYLRDPFAKPLVPRDPTDRDQLAPEVDIDGTPRLLSRPFSEDDLEGRVGVYANRDAG